MLLLLSLANKPAFGDHFGIQVFAPSFHVSPETTALSDDFHYKLDKTGKVMALPGVKVWLDQQTSFTQLGEDSWRYTFGFYRDCMNQNSFAFHFGPRWSLWHIDSSKTVLLGFGPALWARESWTKFKNYKPDGSLRSGSDFLPGYEYLVLPSIDFELDISLNRKTSFSWTIVPALPFFIAQSVGIRTKI